MGRFFIIFVVALLTVFASCGDEPAPNTNLPNGGGDTVLDEGININNNDGENITEDENDPDPKPAPEPDPEPQPEPKPEPQPWPGPEPEPEPEGNGTLLGTFKWTHYWIVYEDDFPEGQATEIVYWKDCTTIASVSRDFYDQVKVEGTGFLSDGRLINKYGDCPSACNMPDYKCFNEVDKNEAPYGHGSHDNPLRPYRSVAIDVDEIPFGTALYIPVLDGVEMPDEHNIVPDAPFIHDGCVVAEDEGSAIQGKHLDFFSLTYLDYRVIDEVMNDIGEVEVYGSSPKCD